MSSQSHTRLKKRVQKRYAELLLRCIHQCGGRDRYVAVSELEDRLGLEPKLIEKLCRTRLHSEVHVAERISAELKNGLGFTSPLERAWIECCYATPHVRIRPASVRLTEQELLLDAPKKRSPKKKKRTPKKRARKQK